MHASDTINCEVCSIDISLNSNRRQSLVHSYKFTTNIIKGGIRQFRYKLVNFLYSNEFVQLQRNVILLYYSSLFLINDRCVGCLNRKIKLWRRLKKRYNDDELWQGKICDLIPTISILLKRDQASNKTQTSYRKGEPSNSTQQRRYMPDSLSSIHVIEGLLNAIRLYMDN